MLKNSSLSFENLKQDAVDYLKSLPEGTVFKDFYLSSNGSLLLDLLAGFSTWSAFKYMNNRGESYLDQARLRTSIVDLAKSKGIFVAPAIPMTLKITFTADETITIAKGDDLGQLNGYYLYASEEIFVETGNQYTVVVYMGFVEEITITSNSSDYYQEIQAKFENPYITDYLELITVNSEVMNPVYTPSTSMGDDTTKNILRYVSDGSTALTFGNGVLGYHLKLGQVINYKTLTYDDGVNSVNPSSASMYYGTLDNAAILVYGSKYIETEDLRRTALYSSINGTLIIPKHYESAILQKFSTYMKDIFVQDEYPSDIVHILPSTIWTEGTLDEIKKLVNLKKGTAVLVSYNILTADKGFDLAYNLDYITTSLSRSEVKSIIDTFNADLIDTIFRTSTTISMRDLVTDLNKASPSSVRFYLAKNQDGTEAQDVTIPLGGYIKSITNFLVER